MSCREFVDDVCGECNQAELQPGKRKRHEVVDWLDTYKLKRSKFESIVDECQNSRGFVINTKEVEDLIKEGQFPNGLVLDDPKTKEVPFYLEPLHGKLFQKNVGLIKEWLSDPLAYSVGVLGMGGVGKTTLMKNIYNQLLQGDCRFKSERVIWVTVSDDCNLYMLQKKVAKAVGVVISYEEDTDKRAAVLCHSIVKMEENVVLFLDDVWESFQLSSIGIPNKENGCKINIIFSTRKEEVCRSIGCKNYVIRVQTLSEREAWELFKNKLETYDDLCFEGQKIAKSVAKECACLPLATIVIARSMKGVFDMRVWKNALAELENPSRGHGDMEKDVLRILKFSYDRLNNELLKQCFLSCVLYPEDTRIYKDDLVQEWIMEGMLDGVGSNSDDQMNKGHTLIKQLQNACLLESGEYEVTMHDLVRDMAISITNDRPRFLVKSGKQLQEVPEEGLWSQDLVKVSLCDTYNITVIPYGMAPRTPILTVLKLSFLSITEIPEPFFDHMKALKILDLSGNKIKRVPEGVSKLENLRPLLLKDCCKLTYLPSLAKLTNLRVLDLDCNAKLEEGVRGIEGLEKLEKVTYCPWIINNNELLECIFELNNGTLPNRILSLPNLEFIDLSDLPKLHYIYEGLLVCVVRLDIYECPELRVLNKSKSVICPSPSTLASISKDPEFWEIFQQHEPLNAAQISYEINQILKCDTMLVDVDNEIEIKEDKLEWGLPFLIFKYVRCEVIADIVF